MRTVFIQTNNKQLLGAKLAQYAIERTLKKKGSVAVQLMNTDELEAFRSFSSTTYIRDGKVMNDEDDLQSFTLSRFLPPEYMGYTGKAVVIDPDVFALTDINELFELHMGTNTILACRKRGAWDTSVMVLDCAQLRHWRVPEMLKALTAHAVNYSDSMTLRHEERVGEIPRYWNDIDHLGPHTRMLHTSIRITQPWKTGLPIDFTRSRDGDRYFGIIPKPWVLRLLGRYPSRYQPHPDKDIERFFFDLFHDAIRAGAITPEEIAHAIAMHYVRPDILRYTPS
jgi:hypothetical protein